jgi:hypothetical protein
MIDVLESTGGSDPGGQGGDASLHTKDTPMGVRRSVILTASFGIAHSLLLMTAFFLLRSQAPSVDAPDGEIVDFYGDAGNRRIVLLAGIYLIPFAAIAFIWFIVALRMWATYSVRRASILFANVQLVSGIIYIGLLLAAGAAISIPAASMSLSDGPLDPDFARQFPHYGVTLFLVLSMRMAAMYVFSTTSFLRTSGLLPRWFLVLGGVVGLALLLSASVSPLLILVFPTWLLVLCVILLIRFWRVPADLDTPDDVVASPLESAAPGP